MFSISPVYWRSFLSLIAVFAAGFLQRIESADNPAAKV